jgi:hypothetical protein
VGGQVEVEGVKGCVCVEAVWMQEVTSRGQQHNVESLQRCSGRKVETHDCLATGW